MDRFIVKNTTESIGEDIVDVPVVVGGTAVCLIPKAKCKKGNRFTPQS